MEGRSYIIGKEALLGSEAMLAGEFEDSVEFWEGCCTRKLHHQRRWRIKADVTLGLSKSKTKITITKSIAASIPQYLRANLQIELLTIINEECNEGWHHQYELMKRKYEACAGNQK
jgi:hypothetical protein